MLKKCNKKESIQDKDKAYWDPILQSIHRFHIRTSYWFKNPIIPEKKFRRKEL